MSTPESLVGIGLIHQYVIDPLPTEAQISESGAQDVVGLLQLYFLKIMGWSGLDISRVEAAIKECPDTIENSDKPNLKLLCLEAVCHIRAAQEEP